MAFDFAIAKAAARRVVQKTFGVQAFYLDDSLSAPVEIRARWHNRIERFGDDDRQGYAEIVEGVERIILIPEIWAADPDTSTVVNTGVLLEMQPTGTVQFPSYSTTFTLRLREPSDGPLEQAWQVTRP